MAEKKIAGHTVRYDRLPADQGLDMLLRVVQQLGHADGILSAFLAEDEKSSEALTLAGMARFAATMNRGEIKSIILEMVSNCRIDGEPAVPAVLDLSELLQIALFALRTEFGSFFEGGAGAALLKAQAA